MAENNDSQPAPQKAAASEPAPLPDVTRRWRRVIDWQDSVTRREEGEEDTAWLITYLDMMTLLLTWFVVLLAFSTFQPDRFTRLKHDADEHAAGQGQQTALRANAANDPAARLAQRLAQQLVQAGLTDAVKMEVEDRRLTLQLQERILFTSGRADLNEQGASILERLSPTFMAPGQMISVEGHTDNIPISTGVFPSNWELSVARASRVVRFLAERGVPAGRLRAVGYGDTRPLADNANEQGRAANRRVSIVIDLAIVGGAATSQ